MFEFTSPFDHLSSTTSSVKKKPVPPQPASVSSGNEDSSSWTTVTDPKRQSVENLLENLTRGQPSQFSAAAVQPQAPAYEAYLSGGDFSVGEHVQSRPPLPPIPTKPVPNRTASPRASPPKNQPQRSQVRLTDPSVLQQGPPQAAVQLPTGLNRREKESSPGPRGGAKPKGSATQTKFSKPQSSPRYIIFDVAGGPPSYSASVALKFRPYSLMFPSSSTKYKLLATRLSLPRLRSSNKIRSFCLELLLERRIGLHMR